jgi:hypothetical protein
MLAILGGVFLAIAAASRVAGDPLGTARRTLVSLLVFMPLTMCTAAAVVTGILHALRRGGVHRLNNVQSGIMSDRIR